MCIQALPALLSAGGAVVQQVGQNQDRADQQRIAGEAARRQEAINRQAGDRVNKQIQEVAASTPDAERAAAQNDFMEALRRSKTAEGSADIGGVPGASDRFTADVGQAHAAAGAEGRKLAGNLAAIDAPTFQRQRENTNFNNTTTDLSLLEGRSRGQDFLTQLRQARAVPSGLTSVGEGLQAFGQSYAGRAVKPKRPSILSTLSPQDSFYGSAA